MPRVSLLSVATFLFFGDFSNVMLHKEEYVAGEYI